MPTLSNDQHYTFIAEGRTSVDLVVDAGSMASVSIRRSVSEGSQQKYYESATVTGIYPGDTVTIAAESGSVTYTVTNLSAVYSLDPTTGSVVGLVGPDGSTLLVTPSITRASGLPFVMPSSGNIASTSGQVTVGTGFDYVIGPSYTYFPANALYSASPAGWYYTNWAALTIGTVYANTYTSGTPEIPSTPTPLTTVVGAYTQVTGFDVTGPNYVIPGGFMGPNGMLEWGRAVNNNNSAGAKVYNTYLGNTNFQGLSQTTNPREAGLGTLRNRGRETAQIGVNAAHGDTNNASSLPRLAIDTRANQIASMTIQLAVATDYAIIEGHHFRVTRAI